MLKILHKFSLVDGVLITGVILVAVGIGLSIKDQYSQETKVEVISKVQGIGVSADIQVDNKVIIDISGEVVKPGVYRLKKGDRIVDVLTIAGGLAANADRQWVERNLNRAEVVVDGQKIFIPKVGDTQVIGLNEKTNGSIGDKVSLNNSDLTELDTLPGIGPSIAQRIIDYRLSNGGFKNVEEIKLVSGVGEKLYEKIKDKIKL